MQKKKLLIRMPEKTYKILKSTAKQLKMPMSKTILYLIHIYFDETTDK